MSARTELPRHEYGLFACSFRPSTEVCAGEEVKAVRVLQAAVANHPQSYALLHVQCDFLRSKGKLEWALKLAKQAVNCAPSEFVTWAKLTEINMELGRWTDALLTLNSCPMFTYNERDLHRMPAPARSHLPVKEFIAASGILDDESVVASHQDADVALLRLPAPSLRGTFAKAYELLAVLVSKIGWDELLKCRSQVFVMEEEYRQQKAKEGPATSADASPNVNGSGSPTVGRRSSGAGQKAESFGPLAVEGDDDEDDDHDSLSDDDAADDDASVKGVPPSIRVSSEHQQQQKNSSEERRASPIPTIKVSTESDGEREREELRRFEEERKATGKGDIEKPVAAAAPSTAEEPKDAEVDAESSATTTTTTNSNAISNKRLCERWLDNLFMVLYEDLRVYTIWRAEIAHFKAQHLTYRKKGTEWEILGELALRLHHRDEAKDAFQRALDEKFSAKAWLKLLEMYADEGDVQRSLNAAIRLSAYQHRWYMETAVRLTIFFLCFV